MIITIQSSNPNLSWVLAKNPVTMREQGAPFTKSFRKGHFYAWFLIEQQEGRYGFRILFKDSEIDCSYNDFSPDHEYLDTTRYASPLIPLSACQEVLRTATRERGEKDVDAVTVVDFTISCKASLAARFQSLSATQDSWISQVSPLIPSLPDLGVYKFELGGNSVFEVTNLMQSICVLAALEDSNSYLSLKNDSVVRYLHLLNRANAPYYLRHLLLSRAIQDRGQFNKFRKEGLINTENLSFQFGNTQTQRHDAIRGELAGVSGKNTGTLFDLGCGELFHTLRLCGLYDQVIAYDADKDLVEHMQAKAKARRLENVTVEHLEFSAKIFEENPGLFEGADLLFSESLEHIELAEAKKILKTLPSVPFRKVVITLPNQDFNPNYGLAPTEFRHPDHKWELTQEILSGFYQDLWSGSNPLTTPTPLTVEVKNIGDRVNGKSLGTMIVLAYSA